LSARDYPRFIGRAMLRSRVRSTPEAHPAAAIDAAPGLRSSVVVAQHSYPSFLSARDYPRFIGRANLANFF
jgi:hypothetical protein